MNSEVRGIFASDFTTVLYMLFLLIWIGKGRCIPWRILVHKFTLLGLGALWTCLWVCYWERTIRENVCSSSIMQSTNTWSISASLKYLESLEEIIAFCDKLLHNRDIGFSIKGKDIVAWALANMVLSKEHAWSSKVQLWRSGSSHSSTLRPNHTAGRQAEPWVMIGRAQGPFTRRLGAGTPGSWPGASEDGSRIPRLNPGTPRLWEGRSIFSSFFPDTSAPGDPAVAAVFLLRARSCRAWSAEPAGREVSENFPWIYMSSRSGTLRALLTTWQLPK